MGFSFFSARRMVCSDCPVFGPIFAQGEKIVIPLIESVVFTPGQILFSESSVATPGIFCLNKGLVLVGKSQPNGEVLPVSFAHRGDILGVSSLPKGRYVNSAEALTAGSACFITRDNLVNHEGLILPAFRKRLMQLMMNDLAEVEDNLTNLPGQNLTQRLYALLVNITGDEKEHAIDVSRLNLAKWLGCSPKSITRGIEQLVEKNYLTKKGTGTGFAINPDMKDRLALIS